ncbi:MBL fold metallo-hydrolase [Parasphingorhabdus halotolerans]|uniref:MBL fold metallo-hydrolase n=1 Tax=Parasphingorhabdus halotolerans TaxID=2725558 RepID=A0A6H2DPC4_9SPHN|nr:MBL fold metallo-hydrolase [Parasphingorhabdus halotolerans]QJB69516.1 MBL fold metallo-hydrolase [Parasphingorhabdus halotolerans]
MRKRILIVFAVLIVTAMSGVFIFQQRIGMAIFDRAVQAQVGTDNSEMLADGLHVGLCGTGSPLPNPDRAGPCNVVIAGKQIYVVDIGEGGARNLNLMAIPIAKVDGVLLTHFHSDHIDGMGPLMLFHWTQGSATAPLPVYGPTGVEAVVDGFNAAYATDNRYRIAHHGENIVPPTGGGAEARPFEMIDDTMVILEKGGLKITAFKVDHDPVDPAVGYRFDYKGRSIVISGDTAKSASLERAAKGADLLVHEALASNMVKRMTAALEKREMTNAAIITKDILDYHASPAEAAESAQIAGVKQLVLSHLVPPLPASFLYPAFLDDAPDKFDGPIIVGEDGMFFSLPADSDVIEQSKLM